MDWLWWVAAALFFALVEVFTLTFVLLMFAGGAVAAAIAAALGAGVLVQVLVFAVVSVVLLVALRSTLVTKFRQTPEHRTNSEALVGREAVALDSVTSTGGRIKLGGEVWTARSAMPATQLQAGERVRVVRIEGATAVVESLHLTTGGPSL